jgi:hypothetical protein
MAPSRRFLAAYMRPKFPHGGYIEVSAMSDFRKLAAPLSSRYSRQLGALFPADAGREAIIPKSTVDTNPGF